MKSTVRESLSTALSTCVDDYGEEEVSLQCYRSEERSTSTLSSFQCIMLSQHDTSDLLEERMAEFDSGKQRCISRSGFRTLFAVDSKLSIELRIRKGATEAVVMISAVVHTPKTLNLHNEKHLLQGGSYSLMTKMMKHNATLKRATWGESQGSHVGVFDGNFLLIADVNTSVLSNKRKLDLVLDEFVSKASEISKDFSQTHESVQIKLRRRRGLIKAYNKTLI
eukprot:CAMPEP_0119024578 /NCGR_PEP_ID=MMETSP1176-20130426/32149_1 /TAXON_ID=265551 /ORGANISM="Synedropsis recta cf, Strain CCMP1620" /LENGTH=222 /DNA_ID=CAMNT_0006979913 /DNA_START=110 /DNA_END=778 /DNA_ORIENTATION=+